MTIEVKKILNITEPEKLFTKDGIANEYKAMAKRFHPDNYVHGSHAAFIKINELHTEGLRKIIEGTWDNHELIMVTPAGRVFKLKYDKKEKTEYGNRFISREHSALSTHLDNFSKRFRKNVCHAQAYIKTNVKLHENFTNLIPVLNTNDFASPLYGELLMMNRPLPEFYSIQSVLNTNEVIPHKQATWIISRLMNLAVLLNKSGMVHNGITTESVFINVHEHTAALLDGWWYSTKKGTKVKSVPTENVNLLSTKERSSKIITSKFDLECIKQIGRKLQSDDTPIQIKQWLKIPATDNVLKELEHWQDSIIIAAYGERKFVKWESYKEPK